MENKQPLAELCRGRFEAQAASGMSIRAWCRENGGPEHGFYLWRRWLGRTRLGLSTTRATVRRPLGVE